MKLITNICEEKKDIVKAMNTTDTMKDVVGEELTINGVIIYEKDEEDEKTGDVKTVTVTAIRTAEGTFYSSISPTVKNSIDAVMEVFTEEEIKAGINIFVKSKTSNGGRDFIYIDL